MNEEYVISGKGFKTISDISFCGIIYGDYLQYSLKTNRIALSKINENEKVFLNLNSYPLDVFLTILKENPPNNNFILIIHNTDTSFTQSKYELIQEYVTKVYAVNNTYNHKNVYTIPIGFARNRRIKSYSIIQKIQPEEHKLIFIYMNFNMKTNLKKREKCYNVFKEKEWVTKEKKIPIEEFYSQLSKSKYVLSPEGYGIDCYRIYESIYYNAIPIIEETKMDHFYRELPVMIVDDWNSITKEKLETDYTKLFHRLKQWKKDNPEWLNVNHWIR